MPCVNFSRFINIAVILFLMAFSAACGTDHEDIINAVRAQSPPVVCATPEEVKAAADKAVAAALTCSTKADVAQMTAAYEAQTKACKEPPPNPAMPEVVLTAIMAGKWTCNSHPANSVRPEDWGNPLPNLSFTETVVAGIPALKCQNVFGGAPYSAFHFMAKRNNEEHLLIDGFIVDGKIDSTWYMECWRNA